MLSWIGNWYQKLEWKLAGVINSCFWSLLTTYFVLREGNENEWDSEYIAIFGYLALSYVFFHLLFWFVLHSILWFWRKSETFTYLIANAIVTLILISNYIFVMIFGKQLGLEGFVMMMRGWKGGELGDFTSVMLSIALGFSFYLLVFYLIYFFFHHLFRKVVWNTVVLILLLLGLGIPIPFLHDHLVSLSMDSWKMDKRKHKIPWQSITGFPEDKIRITDSTTEDKKLPAYFINPPENPDTLELSNALNLKNKIPAVLELDLKVQRPLNVLFINVEGLRYDMLNPTNAPNLYKFASSRGKILKKHYSTGNNTPGSLIGMFTGLSPFHFEPLRENGVPNLPLEILKKLGYRQSVYYNSPKYYEYIYRDFLERTEGKFVKIPGRIEDYAPREKQLINEYLRELAEDKSNLPRFDYYLVNVTHFNYYYPPEFEIHKPAFTMDFEIISGRQEKFEKHKEALMNRYLNSILYFDHLFGIWISELERLGRLENTIIALAGDHGEEFWEHGSFGHTWGLNNKQIQTSAVLYYPGIQAQDIRYNYTSHADFLPTVFDLIGLNLATEVFMSGKSLLRYNPKKDYSISSLGVLVSFKRNDYAIIGNGLKILFKNNRNLNDAAYAIYSDQDENAPSPDPYAVTDLLKKIVDSKRIKIAEDWEFPNLNNTNGQ